jgi:hypothetical protein
MREHYALSYKKVNEQVNIKEMTPCYLDEGVSAHWRKLSVGIHSVTRIACDGL